MKSKGTLTIRTRKVKLAKIIKDITNEDGKTNKQILCDAVARTNKIVIHTLQFLQAYILHLYDQGIELPTINKKFIMTIMRFVSFKTNKCGAKDGKDTVVLKQKFLIFYNRFFKTTDDFKDKVCYDNLKQSLDYEAEKIVAEIETNIRFRYVQHLNKLINICCRKDSRLSRAKTTEQRNLIYQCISKMKQDIFNVTDSKLVSDKKKHKLISQIRDRFIPHKKSFAENNIAYDVKVCPFDYLESMIEINRAIEHINEIRNKEYPLFHILPLRTSIVPKYITLDTAAIVQLFVKEGYSKYLKNITLYKKQIWKKLFLKSNLFRKRGYSFHGMIQTDGIGCSIMFSREISEKDKQKATSKKNKQEFGYVTKENAKDTVVTNRVYIDPGHKELIYAMDELGDTMCYSRAQRNHESKLTRYKDIYEKFKTDKIENKTVEEWESTIPNSKTCDLAKFLNYIKIKNQVNEKLFSHYRNGHKFRTMKFNLYSNTQRSESKLVKDFAELYGSPKTTTVIFGDYGQANKKGNESSPTMRMKRLFERHKYKVLLIDEYNTSKLCHVCHNPLEKVFLRDDKFPTWRIVACTNKKCLQSSKKISFEKRYRQRDLNACKNMKYIVDELAQGRDRPAKYTNQNK